jgi:hypothetical protein
MLRRFAANISESKDWCTYWEINRHDRPAPVDYRNDREFWYNLPANFDIIDACYRNYLWTHDPIYLSDPDFLNFYARSVEDYVERWDLKIGTVLSRDRFMNRSTYDPEDAYQFCRGIPSYHEGDPGKTRVGIDLLALQAAAYHAYSRFLALGGDGSNSKRYTSNSLAVRQLIEESFWNPAEQRYYDLLLTDGTYTMSGGMQVYLLYSGMSQHPERIQNVLQSILRGPPLNIEIRSHYPEVFFEYGEPEAAVRTMLDLSDPQSKRRTYPEVSYAIIRAYVSGLMGVEPSEERSTIATLSRLPGHTDWAAIDHMPYHGLNLALKHEGQHQSTLTNRGSYPVTWIARFPDPRGRLKVSGKRMPSHRGSDVMGRSYVWGRVTVAPGSAVTVTREIRQ